MDIPTIVVGAGISGLACAAKLAQAGRRSIVLERSRGLGGRCATRRVGGQPVDHGVAFLHGRDEAFLAIAADVEPGERLAGWPGRVEGDGPPCLPKAFEAGEFRLAYASGMTEFPRRLARGLEVRRSTAVDSVSIAPEGVVLGVERGPRLRARDVVLAVPAPTARRLLAPLAALHRDAAAMIALLGWVGSQACLTAIAGYPLDRPEPAWDVLYPSDSAAVQAIIHDSAKRRVRDHHVLVIQARPCWSRLRMEESEDAWSKELVREAGRLVGAWAGAPAFAQPHLWRFARADTGTTLSRPLLLRGPGGGRIVVAGEYCAPGGGLEAAWLAGTASARRLLDEE